MIKHGVGVGVGPPPPCPGVGVLPPPEPGNKVGRAGGVTVAVGNEGGWVLAGTTPGGGAN